MGQLLRKLNQLKRMSQTGERTVWIRRSYAPNSEIKPAPEQEQEAERLVQEAKRQHPHARHFIIRYSESGVSVTPTGER